MSYIEDARDALERGRIDSLGSALTQIDKGTVNMVLDLLAAAIDDDLSAAWAAAEAALPAWASMRLERSGLGNYVAIASDLGSWYSHGSSTSTPAAALRALAAKLQETSDERPRSAGQAGDGVALATEWRWRRDGLPGCWTSHLPSIHPNAAPPGLSSMPPSRTSTDDD